MEQIPYACGRLGALAQDIQVRSAQLPALREALAAGRCTPILRQHTPHIRKGLSQWTKARRRGGAYGLCRAAAYVGYCAILDIFRR